MATLRVIIEALENAAERGESVVMATVVRITGSSYGGVGARMIIEGDGSTIGIVSGGCLESDLAEHAHNVLETKIAKVVTYDTRADDDAAWGLGLGCNGLIDVLLEPLDPARGSELAHLLAEALDASEESVLATLLEVRGDRGAIGARALVRREGALAIGEWPDPQMLEAVRGDSAATFPERRRGLIREYPGGVVAFEVLIPAVQLVICGAGPDVVPVVRNGVELGWYLTVVDHRPVTPTHSERFPGARTVECFEPSAIGDAITLTSRTAAVVMSHHYARDMEYMKALLGSPVAYIGMLGPRSRTERMIADINSSGGKIQGSERLYSPVGLDIGGEGPDGIALSIIAEISAVMCGSSGQHLRDVRAALHPPRASETLR